MDIVVADDSCLRHMLEEIQYGSLLVCYDLTFHVIVHTTHVIYSGSLISP